MAKLVWDQVGQKLYETGVAQGVLYTITDGAYSKGVAWNGLSKVSESPSGAESSPVYADNQQYLNLISAEKYSATIEAYTFPEEFMECDGSKSVAKGVYVGQQTRKTFGFSYKTLIGNDANSTDYGYKIHLVYGAVASPSQKEYGTVSDTPEAISLSWEISTTPVEVPGSKPSATIVIDSTKTTTEKLAALENILYGTNTDGSTTAVEPRMPLPSEIITLMAEG